MLASGEREGLKACVHATAGGLAAVCWGYNVAAFVKRGELHLAINALLYFGIVLWEVEHVRHHRCAR